MRTLKHLIFKLLLEIPLCVRAEGCRRTEPNAGLSSEAEGDGSPAVQAVEWYRLAGLVVPPCKPRNSRGRSRRDPVVQHLPGPKNKYQASQGYIAKFCRGPGGGQGYIARFCGG